MLDLSDATISSRLFLLGGHILCTILLSEKKLTPCCVFPVGTRPFKENMTSRLPKPLCSSSHQ